MAAVEPRLGSCHSGEKVEERWGLAGSWVALSNSRPKCWVAVDVLWLKRRWGYVDKVRQGKQRQAAMTTRGLVVMKIWEADWERELVYSFRSTSSPTIRFCFSQNGYIQEKSSEASGRIGPHFNHLSVDITYKQVGPTRDNMIQTLL